MLMRHLRNWRRSILDKYKVVLSKRAYRDLNDIYAYIAYEKDSLDNANKLLENIKKSILGLSEFPQSHQDRLLGRYANKGYKQLMIDNYISIFRIDVKKKMVYVVTIQYQKRDL